MPKSTAVWLVENTSLTFEQISKFCNLHILEIQGIADGEVAVGIQGKNPIMSGELTKEEIQKCEMDPSKHLEIIKDEIPLSSTLKKGKKKFTPASRRQVIPDAISWLIKYHPELKDAQISRLLGTTKTTITAVRSRSHWNIVNIKAQDPVLLGLCKQIELEAEVLKASKSNKRTLKAAAANTETAE